jgi:type VI secretion system secreted protein Hcp
MRDLKWTVHLLVAVAVIAGTAGPAAAQDATPLLITYQGELRSTGMDEPLPDGNYDMVFRIYDVGVAGTPLWEGTHSAENGNPAELRNGMFSVILGSGIGNTLTASLFSRAELWLEVQVGLETLSPRQRIISVPYLPGTGDAYLTKGGTGETADPATTGALVFSGRVTDQEQTGARAAAPDADDANTITLAESGDTVGRAPVPAGATISSAVSTANADDADAVQPLEVPESGEPAAVSRTTAMEPLQTYYDMFLLVEGIPGDSADASHKDWIEIVSYNHKISQPAGTGATALGIHTSARADHQDFSISKRLDSSSPKLALFCCTGEHIANVRLELCYAVGEKKTFMVYVFHDVIVSSVSPGGSVNTSDPLPMEEVTFRYGGIGWEFTPMDPSSGITEEPVGAGWNRLENKAI